MSRLAAALVTAVGSPAAAFADQASQWLLAVGRTGNRDAFLALFEFYAPRLKTYGLRAGLSDSAASDLAQDVMLRVWQQASQFDPARGPAAAWIFTIARNRRIDLLRHEPYPQAALLWPEWCAEDSPDPEQEEIQRQEASRLRSLLARLPAEQQTVIRHSFFHDQTQRDIARQLRLPLGTVKSRLRLALRQLRRWLGEP